MKYFIFFLVTASYFQQLLAQQKPAATTVQQMFNAQVNASAAQGFQYAKTFSEKAGSTETHSFRVKLNAEKKPWMYPLESAKKEGADFAEELAYAHDNIFQQPAPRDYFTITNVGDTVSAVLKPGNEEHTILRAQRYVLAADHSHLLYLETHAVRKSLLYDLSIDVRVYFDSKGLYSHHDLQFNTRIAFFATTTHAGIKGAAAY